MGRVSQSPKEKDISEEVSWLMVYWLLVNGVLVIGRTNTPLTNNQLTNNKKRGAPQQPLRQKNSIFINSRTNINCLLDGYIVKLLYCFLGMA